MLKDRTYMVWLRTEFLIVWSWIIAYSFNLVSLSIHYEQNCNPFASSYTKEERGARYNEEREKREEGEWWTDTQTHMHK